MEELKLYQKLPCGSDRLPGSGEMAALPPARLAVAFLSDISRSFSQNPDVYHTEGNRMLTLLYHNVSFSCGDFAAEYGELMAALSRRWPVTVYGTAFERETGELRAVQGEGMVYFSRSSVSGEDFDTLSGLCIKLETGTPEDCARMAEIFCQIRFWQDTMAVPRTLESFCTAQGLCRPINGAYFCYLPTEGKRRLACLSLERKAELWEVFLSENLSPLEFDWLLDAYQQGEAPALLEWELALQAVVERLRISIVNRREAFEVRDSGGRQLRFDYDRGSAAEKMFLKLLFPVRPGQIV